MGRGRKAPGAVGAFAWATAPRDPLLPRSSGVLSAFVTPPPPSSPAPPPTRFARPPYLPPMTRALPLAAALLLAACASTPVYGPAERASDYGYRSQTIEDGRYRVSYRGKSLALAEDGALRRAAELTTERGADWFTVVSRAADGQPIRRGGPSVGIGGSTGGRRGGVGLGVSLPLGGGGSVPVTVSMEVVTGSGPKPDGAQTYDARSVLANVTRA